jgi:cellulose synthase/poly-beta-1,6-N-acetylglucosamine synthase-like glycosyltransferase
MNDIVNIFLWTYGVLFAAVVLYGFVLQRNKERRYEQGDTVNAFDITVLIPFRNEVDNLPVLLAAIQNLSHLPHKFIFIDDHSEDGSVALIHDALHGISYQVIAAGEGRKGKKMALRQGANHVTTPYTLTWDADVDVPKDYFKSIEQLGQADMYVLPAILTSNSFAQHVYTFDVIMANAVNMGLSGWYRPIFASGANLLYRTEQFNRLDSIEQHAHISSGDDTFLLLDFVRAKADVRTYSNPRVAVYTPAPTTFKAYLNQRLRWVSKTNALKDGLNTSVALVQLFLTVAFVVIALFTVLHQSWAVVIYLVLCKIMTDFLVFASYFKRIGRLSLLVLLPLAEFWYPFYALLLAILMPFYTPKWKERDVIVRK